MAGRPEPAVLPAALRVPLGTVAVLAALVVVALGILFAGDSGPAAVDARIQAVADGVGPPWRYLAQFLDFLGEPVGSVLVVLSALIGCLLLRRPRAAVLVPAGVGVTVMTTTLLKFLVGRTIHGPDNLSYPSGHTAFATALAVIVALLAADRSGLGRAAGTSLVLAAASAAGGAMGWAEVALGAHYPTDALGGWCTALAVTPALARLVDRTADRMTGRGADRTDERMADAGGRGR